MEKPIVIIQTGHVRTGTTLLTNLLYGFMIPEERVRGYWNLKDDISLFNDKVNIYKSHLLDLHRMNTKLSSKFNLFFVCTERGDLTIPQEYHIYPNVLIINYDEIEETEDQSL
jgi:hypothetical protein